MTFTITTFIFQPILPTDATIVICIVLVLVLSGKIVSGCRVPLVISDEVPYNSKKSNMEGAQTEMGSRKKEVGEP